MRDARGFYGVGIEHGKNIENIGTLWRSAYSLGASFVFTVGRRYRRQCSDTVKAYRHIPLYNYATLDDLHAHLPFDCQLVGVELDERAKPIETYIHPQRACYLLGAEDHGLTKDAMARCHQIVQLPGRFCLNVSVAGSIVMAHRAMQRGAAVETAA